jgi:hypothetical protein
MEMSHKIKFSNRQFESAAVLGFDAVIPEDGDGMFLSNIGVYLLVNTASESRRATSLSLLP